MNTKCKLLALVLAVIFVFVGMVSCKKNEDNPQESDTTSTTVQGSGSSEPGNSSEEPSGSVEEPSDSAEGTESSSGEPVQSGTSGTENPPKPTEYVEISNEAELVDAAKKISANTDGYASKKFVLTADITLTAEFAPISGFTGIFDGQFHTISGLTVDSDKAEVGMFTTLNGATVQNLAVVAVSVKNSVPTAKVGILAGSVSNAKISCVTVSGKVELGGNRAIAGGLVGEAKDSTLSNVKSTATVSGGGATVAGIVGNLSEKAMLVNAYSGASVTSTATVKASAVGTKVADSAVAFVLVKDGAVVGSETKPDYMPSYVAGCKVGAAASTMGWNTVDWDVSGSEPSLKKTADKKYSAPKVTVNGTSVAVAFGNSLPASAKPSNLGENKVFAGFLLGGAGYYEALPVVNDLTLTNDIVDFTCVAGKWVSLNANTASITVGSDLSVFDNGATLLGVTTENSLPVAYAKNSDGSVVRLCVKTLTDAEKKTFGYTVDGAALLVKEKAVASGYETLAYYMPTPTENLGAWTIDGKSVIYTADVVADKAVNSFRSMTVGVSLDTYKTCVTVANGKLSKIFDGFKFEIRNEVPSLVKGSVVATVAKDCYNGNWVDAQGGIFAVEGGKVGDSVLTVKTTSDGTGLWDEKTQTLYIVNVSGLTAYKTGTAVKYSKGNFSGEWVVIKNGVESVLTIAGNKVTLPNGTIVDATVTADSVTGAASIVIPMDGASVSFTSDGVALKSDDGSKVYYSSKAVSAFYGTFIYGTNTFVIEKGKASLYSGLRLYYTYDLTLDMEDGALVANAGGMKFSVEGGKLYVVGAEANVLNNTKIRLFTLEELAVTYASLKGDWTAVSYNVKYPQLKMSFSNRTLKIDGVEEAYDIALNASGKITVYANVKYEGKDVTLSLTPVSEFFIATGGASVGYLMPEVLADSVGSYYEFLVGSTEEGALAPKVIKFSQNGEITLNGTTYKIEDYRIEFVGDQVVAEIINPNAAEYGELITFTGVKTLRYKNTTYKNYNYIIPADVYYQIGATQGVATLQVVSGSTGRYEYDYDEEEDIWIEPVYPLFGFRYTDASGVAYTSDSFTWSKANGVVTLNIRLKSANEKVVVLDVKYPAGNDFSHITISANGGSKVDYYSSTEIATMAGAYSNKNNSFELGINGVLTVNGKPVNYTIERKKGVDTFTVGSKKYVIDRATPEIMKCGSEVFYDSRFAGLANLELQSFRRGDSKAERKFTMKLTDDGFYFEGKKVVWDFYDMFSSNIRFTALCNVNGKMQSVTWKFESSGAIDNFGFQMYANTSFGDDNGWPQRWFVPSILLDAATYATNSQIITIQQPDYSNYFTPFIFMLDYDQYGYKDYNITSDNGKVVVTLDTSNTLVFEKTDSGVKVTLNGEKAEEYEVPSLDDFAMDNVKPVFSDKYTYGITIAGDTITYYPTSTWSKSETKVFSNGIWNGMPVIYFKLSGKNFAVVKTQNGPVPVLVGLLNLLGEANAYGKKVTATLNLDPSGSSLTVVHDGKEATDIVVDSKNLPYDNAYFIEYTVDGEVYAIVPDVFGGTDTKIVLTKELFDSIAYGNLDVEKYSFSLYIYPSLDKNGNGSLLYRIFERYNAAPEVFVTPTPVKGVEKVYSSVIEAGGEKKTVYYAINPGTNNVVKSIDEKLLAILGTHTANNGEEITIKLSLGGLNDYDVSYKGNDVVGTWDSTEKTLKFKVKLNDVETSCYVSSNEGVVFVDELSAAKDAFVTGTSSYNGFSLIGGGYYDKANVVYSNGGFVVTFKSNATTDVHFNSDNTVLFFTQDGVEYAIVMVNPTGSYKAAVITGEQNKFVGKHTVDGKVFQVAVEVGYTPKLSVSFDGKTASDVAFYGDGLMSFKVGNNYCAAVVENDTVKVYEGIIDTNDILYNYLGSYPMDKDGYTKLSISLEVKKTSTGVSATYAVLKDGNPVEYTMDSVTKVLTVKENSNVKYYTLITGSTKYAAELTAADVAMLGEYTIGSDKVLLIPNYTASYNSRREEYTATAGYSLKLNDGSAVSVKFENDNGSPAKKYIKFTQNGTTYLFYVVSAGNATLKALTADELAMFGVSTYITVNGSYKYLKTNLVFAEDGTFTLGLAFDNKPITDKTDIENFGFSFKSADGDVYYAVVASGSIKYLVSAEQYSFYTDEIKLGDDTLVVKPGSSSSYMFEVVFNGKDATGEKYNKVGEYAYIQFTVGSDVYVLAKDTENNDAFVVTKLDASQAAALTFSINYLKLPKADGTLYTSATLASAVSVDKNGLVSVGYSYGSNPTPTVEFPEVPAGINGEVVKVTIEGNVLYILRHKWNATSSSYDNSIYTEAQYALLGTHTVDGKVIVVGFSEPSGYNAYLQVTYDDAQVKSSTISNGALAPTSGNVCFKKVTVGDATVDALSFTVNGTAYLAYILNGVYTIVVA